MRVSTAIHSLASIIRKTSCGFALFAGALIVAPHSNAQEDPIAYIGHGALFDNRGVELAPTPELVGRAQAFYREVLRKRIGTERRSTFDQLERSIPLARIEGQRKLVVQQSLLEWLWAANTDRSGLERLGGKIGLLSVLQREQLPTPDSEKPLRSGLRFDLDKELVSLIKKIEKRIPTHATPLSITTNRGQAYIDECIANGVPVPPPIGVLDPNGTAGWQQIGQIPPTAQFIVRTQAEVRAYKSASPEGVCIALPRWNANNANSIDLDGVICLGRMSSKVCFWDNQMWNAAQGRSMGFSFNNGDRIPIGVPDAAVDPSMRYQAGGAEIESGTGGVCTDCHAGQNPYVIHPKVQLVNGPRFGDLAAPPHNLPMFGNSRYDPIVGASWPQNDLSMSPALVPPGCDSCHVPGDAGAFPHLNSAYVGYCNTVLAQAVAGTRATMPPRAPGSLATDPAVQTFRDWCSQPASAGPWNRGDPHLKTTNDIRYDFQAAGEFMALRNSSSRFELQTRQTPVITTFIPQADTYTGLQQCVSVNTAAAIRLGKNRVTVQPGPREGETRGRHELRVNGNLVTIPPAGLNFPDGSRIAMADTDGALDVRAADGSRLLITPQFWSDQGVWYLDIDTIETPAREGTMSAILPGNWLPLAPDGSSFGPAPATDVAKHQLLNVKFADAWRVTPANSLFDYLPGTSTNDFTDRNWPTAPGLACTHSKIALPKRAVPMNGEAAAQVCQAVKDKVARQACVFDAIVTGNKNIGKAYRRQEALRAAMQP